MGLFWSRRNNNSHENKTEENYQELNTPTLNADTPTLNADVEDTKTSCFNFRRTQHFEVEQRNNNGGATENTGSQGASNEKIKKFEEWAKKKGLNQTTIDTLIDQDWNDFSVLKSVLDDAFRKLNLSSDQQNLLLKAVAELRLKEAYLTPVPIGDDSSSHDSFQDQEEHENEDMVVKAMYDSDARENSDLKFKAGDTFTMTKKSKQCGWWWLRHEETGNEGFVSTNIIVPEKSYIKQNRWWAEVDKEGAERRLFLYGDGDGAFLVRPSSEGTVVLSVRFGQGDPTADLVKHYTVTLEDCGKCFIYSSQKFPSVADLIQAYKANDGLCCHLTRECTEVKGSVPYRVIEESALTFDEKIGRGQGSFTDIYKGKWRNQLDVAVKKVAVGTIKASDFIEKAKELHTLSHPNLVQRIGACHKELTDSKKPIYIVEELMIHGCLRNYLINQKPKNADLHVLAQFATQIASGMVYLASRNIVHRNVRAENMLVGANKTVKVSGLSLVRFLSNNEQDDSESIYVARANPDLRKIEVKWAALESIEKEVFTIKSDVWSFGVLLYELITYGDIPYVGMDDQAVIEYLQKGNRLQIASSKVSENANVIHDRMLQCWEANPENRPSFDELHNFFAGFDPDYV